MFERILPAVLDRATSADSRVHGLAHWRTVARIGGELAAATPGASPEIVGAFAALHDCQRVSDGHDPEHGARAAYVARELRASGILDLDDARLARLCHALADHDRGQVSSDPTIGACWDADRLDLGRVGVKPIASLLSTKAARERVSAERATEPRSIGWRVWRLTLDGLSPMLASPETGDLWKPRVPFVATCKLGDRVPPHAIPGAACSCGVYVSPDVRRALGGFFFSGVGGGSGYVAGRVRLSGLIVPSGHAEGEWRGERATILSLALPRAMFTLRRALEETYGVPVETVRDLRTLGDDVGVGLNVNDDDRLELLYEINGWRRKRDELGRLIPPEALVSGHPRRPV